METTVVSESPAAAPGCIYPGLRPGPLYTHTHTRTHARRPWESPRQSSHCHMHPPPETRQLRGRADPALCQGTKAWLPTEAPAVGQTRASLEAPHTCTCVCTHDKALS